MKNVFNKLIIRLHMAEEKSDELKERSREISQILMQRFFFNFKRKKSKNMKQYQKMQQTLNLNARAKANHREEIFGLIMSENYPQLLADIKPQIQESQRH